MRGFEIYMKQRPQIKSLDQSWVLYIQCNRRCKYETRTTGPDMTPELKHENISCFLTHADEVVLWYPCGWKYRRHNLNRPSISRDTTENRQIPYAYTDTGRTWLQSRILRDEEIQQSQTAAKKDVRITNRSPILQASAVTYDHCRKMPLRGTSGTSILNPFSC